MKPYKCLACGSFNLKSKILRGKEILHTQWLTESHCKDCGAFTRHSKHTSYLYSRPLKKEVLLF